jgi:hypothetical protein
MDLGEAMSNRSKRLRKGVTGKAYPRWSAEDALRIREQLCDWLRTREGIKAVYLHYYRLYGGSWPESVTDPWQLSTVTAVENADLLADTELIWCDPPMVELLTAAADTFPSNPLEPHHLPSPSGIAIFAQPVPAIWEDERSETTQLHRISAITWGTGADGDGNPLVGVDGWVRASGQGRYRNPDLTISYRHLRLHTNALGHFGADQQGAGGAASPARLLQTLAALCRSPLVKNEPGLGTVAGALRRRRGPSADQAIRRIYLRRPEHGAAELQAARDAHAGRSPRGHWVRGHWKQQWYPSIEEHRPLWVEGYPRGDFIAGTVGGTKVLIATDRVDSSGEASARG